METVLSSLKASENNCLCYAVALVEVVAASRKQYCFAILELHGGGGQVLHIACLKNSRAEP